jgi:hypothetical protein
VDALQYTRLKPKLADHPLAPFPFAGALVFVRLTGAAGIGFLATFRLLGRKPFPVLDVSE